jgi:hypothetical protein
LIVAAGLRMKTFTPPCILPPIIPPEKWITVDLAADQPNWGPQLLENLAEYHRTGAAALAHDEAGKAARALVPDDVGKVLAGKYNIVRDSRGRLAIRTARRNGK